MSEGNGCGFNVLRSDQEWAKCRQNWKWISRTLHVTGTVILDFRSQCRLERILAESLARKPRRHLPRAPVVFDEGDRALHLGLQRGQSGGARLLPHLVALEGVADRFV